MTRPVRVQAKAGLRLAASLLAAATLLSALALNAATSATIVFTVDSTADTIDDDLGDGLCHIRLRTSARCEQP